MKIPEKDTRLIYFIMRALHLIAQIIVTACFIYWYDSSIGRYLLFGGFFVTLQAGALLLAWSWYEKDLYELSNVEIVVFFGIFFGYALQFFLFELQYSLPGEQGKLYYSQKSNIQHYLERTRSVYPTDESTNPMKAVSEYLILKAFNLRINPSGNIGLYFTGNDETVSPHTFPKTGKETWQGFKMNLVLFWIILPFFSSLIIQGAIIMQLYHHRFIRNKRRACNQEDDTTVSNSPTSSRQTPFKRLMIRSSQSSLSMRDAQPSVDIEHGTR